MFLRGLIFAFLVVVSVALPTKDTFETNQQLVERRGLTRWLIKHLPQPPSSCFNPFQQQADLLPPVQTPPNFPWAAVDPDETRVDFTPLLDRYELPVNADPTPQEVPWNVPEPSSSDLLFQYRAWRSVPRRDGQRQAVIQIRLINNTPVPAEVNMIVHWTVSRNNNQEFYTGWIITNAEIPQVTLDFLYAGKGHISATGTSTWLPFDNSESEHGELLQL